MDTKLEEYILITGANGFVGSNVLEKLVDNNYNIIALDLYFSDKKYSNVNYIECDITDINSVEDIFNKYKISHIIHLSGIIAKDEEATTIKLVTDVNISGTTNIAYCANKYSSHLIFFSTGLVYGNQPSPFVENMKLIPNSYYGFSKKLGEETLRYYLNKNKKFSYTIFRPSIIYGPNQLGNMFIPSLIKSYNNNESFKMTKGEQTRDFIYIDDVTNAVIFAINKNLQGEYNLSYGKSYKMCEIAQFSQEISNIKIELGALAYREHEVWDYSLSNNKLKEIGWEPKTDIKTGLKNCFKI